MSSLLELVAREQRLAAEGPVEELAVVQEELAEVLGALPERLDPVQRETLTRAYAMREHTIALLRGARDHAASEVARLDHGRTAVRGYAPAGVQAGPSVDAAV